MVSYLIVNRRTVGFSGWSQGFLDETSLEHGFISSQAELVHLDHRWV